MKKRLDILEEEKEKLKAELLKLQGELKQMKKELEFASYKSKNISSPPRRKSTEKTPTKRKRNKKELSISTFYSLPIIC